MESFRHYSSNEDGDLTFTFYKTFTLEGMQFLVIASDFNSKFQMFHMQKEDKQWKIIDAEKLPGWILKVETDLSKTIENSLVFA